MGTRWAFPRPAWESCETVGRARPHTEVREALLAVVLELLLREVLVEIAVRVIHAPGEGKEDRGSKTSPQRRKRKC